MNNNLILLVVGYVIAEIIGSAIGEICNYIKYNRKDD